MTTEQIVAALKKVKATGAVNAETSVYLLDRGLIEQSDKWYADDVVTDAGEAVLRAAIITDESGEA